MKQNWKFSELKYERPDSEQVVKDLRETAEKIRAAQSGEEVLSLIMEHEQRDLQLSTLLSMVNIRHTLDTRDAFYEKENEWIGQTMPTILPDSLALADAIAESHFRNEIEEKLGKQFFAEIDLQKKCFCPENIPLMQAEAKLTDEYQKIMVLHVLYRIKSPLLEKHLREADRSDYHYLRENAAQIREMLTEDNADIPSQ